MARASTESIIDTIDTRAGRVRGSLEAPGVVFRGIPFAAPPLATLRFSAPQPVEPWRGVRDAFEPAPAPPQRCDGLLETHLGAVLS